MIPGLGSIRSVGRRQERRRARQAANLMALLDTDPHLDPTVIAKTSDRVSGPMQGAGGAESRKV